MDAMNSASEESISASSLLQLLLYGRRGSWKTKEQDAFIRLVAGYKDVSQLALVCASLVICASMLL